MSKIEVKDEEINEKAKKGLAILAEHKERERRRKNAAVGIPIEVILAMREEGMGVKEIARELGVSHQNISKRLKKVQKDVKRFDRWKKYKADVLAWKQKEILDNLTEEDIKKASVREKAVLFGVLYDKERLERGKSTQNISIAHFDAELAKLEEEERRLKKELGIVDVEVTPEDGTSQ